MKSNVFAWEAPISICIAWYRLSEGKGGGGIFGVAIQRECSPPVGFYPGLRVCCAICGDEKCFNDASTGHTRTLRGVECGSRIKCDASSIATYYPC